MARNTISLGLTALLAGPCAAQLENTSFESAGSGTPFAHWSTFGPVSATGQLATDGTRAARVGVVGSGGFALSGVYQDLSILPGQHVRVTAKAGFTGSFPVEGDTRGVANVEWRDAAGNLISYDSVSSSMSADAPGSMNALERVVGPAPFGTASARLVLGVFETPEQNAGHVHYDEADMVVLDAIDASDIEWNTYGGRTIEWSGQTWRVARGGFFDPGYNLWSDSEDAVWVDDQDRLHMRIFQVGGQWYSTAIALTEPTGYADYQFTAVGRIDEIDINTVVGLFTWEYLLDYSGVGGPDNITNEFDIEFSRWQQPDNDPAQFVAQPWQQNQISRYDFSPADDEALTTHAFEWSAAGMDCRAWYGDDILPNPADMIHTWNYQGPLNPTPGDAKILINHWMIGQPPTDLQDQTIILNSFRLLPACRADVNADGTATPADFTAWLACFSNPGGQGCDGADVNRDGVISPADFTAWLAAFNAGCD